MLNMRHMHQKNGNDCGVASVAMLLNRTYGEVAARAPEFEYREGGFFLPGLLKLLRKLSKYKKWKALRHPVPIPFRHFSPTAAPALWYIARITPNGTSFIHIVAFDGVFIHDPDEPRRVRLEDAKRQAKWRMWVVTAEVYLA